MLFLSNCIRYFHRCKSIRYVMLIGIISSLIGCTTTTLPETPPLNPTLSNEQQTPLPSIAPPSPTSPPRPTATRIPFALRNAVYHETGWNTDILLIPDTPPQFVNIDPDNKILFIGHQGDTIYEVNDDGSLTTYAHFPGVKLEGFHFDPSGQLWLSTNRDGIFRVNDAGKLVRVADGRTNRRFDFDSPGNLYAVDFPSPNIQKITPQGEISILVDNFPTAVIAVNSSDEVFSMDRSGRLVQIMPGGQLKTIAENLGNESNIGFAPDGTLYNLDWSGLYTIDVQVGTVNKVGWYEKYSNTGNGIVIDRLGNMYTYHPNHPIYRVSLTNRTSEMIYQAKGNTTAMALSPNGEVYLAYGDQLPSGKSTIYRLTEAGQLKEILNIPFGLALSLAFDSTGKGYIGAADRQAGSTITAFDPVTGMTTEIDQPSCFPQSIAVDPVTDDLWWFSCDQLFHRDTNGNIRNIPAPDNATNKFIFFGPDGKLYAIIWFAVTSGTIPAPHGVYSLTANETWTELVDLSTDNPYITWAMGAVCPDNSLYIITHLDAQKMGVRNWKGELNGILRLNSDGTLKTMAGGFSNDAFAVACDRQTGDLIFTTIDAIFRLHQDK